MKAKILVEGEELDLEEGLDRAFSELRASIQASQEATRRLCRVLRRQPPPLPNSALLHPVKDDIEDLPN